MDPGAGVGRAGAAGDEGDAGAPGHLAVGIGHVGDPALLPADDGVDVGRVVERVEHREEALAGNREDAVAAVDAKLVDEDAAPVRVVMGACSYRTFSASTLPG